MNLFIKTFHTIFFGKAIFTNIDCKHIHLKINVIIFLNQRLSYCNYIQIYTL